MRLIKYQIKPAKIIFIIFAISFLVITAFFFQKYFAEIIELVNKLGWLAPVLFLVIYCLATILLLPTMVITLAGGAIFGPVFGTILNLFGATWGAAFSFLITRYLMTEWFAQRKSNKLHRLIHDAEQKGWVLVALLRLFPIIPFNIVNYSFGITRIKFRTYLITTFIFLIPGEIVYTYFGYAGMGALLKQGNFYTNGGLILAGIAVGLLFLFKFGLLHFKRYRSKKNLFALSKDVSS